MIQQEVEVHSWYYLEEAEADKQENDLENTQFTNLIWSLVNFRGSFLTANATNSKRIQFTKL